MSQVHHRRAAHFYAASNNGMHPTADTPALMFPQSLGAAGDAGRWAASGVTKTQKVVGPISHERKQLRLAGKA
jgi:hypothetical protein